MVALTAEAAGPGDLDISFDTDGWVTTDFGGTGDVGCAAAIQSDWKIVVAGYANPGADFDFAVARYHGLGATGPPGTLDTANFGTNGTGGTVLTDFGGDDRISSVAMQTDGKIVVAGWSNANGNNDFALARYNGNGTPDTSFGTLGTGKVLTDFFGGVTDVSVSVTIQSDGKIVVTGAADLGFGGLYDFAVARYWPGALSSTPVPGVGWPGLLALAFGLAAVGSLTVVRRARARRAGQGDGRATPFVVGFDRRSRVSTESKCRITNEGVRGPRHSEESASGGRRRIWGGAKAPSAPDPSLCSG